MGRVTPSDHISKNNVISHLLSFQNDPHPLRTTFFSRATFPRCNGKGISDFWKVGVLTPSPGNSRDTLASSERLLIQKGEGSPPGGCDRCPEGEGRAPTGAGRPRRSFRQGFLLPYPSRAPSEARRPSDNGGGDKEHFKIRHFSFQTLIFRCQVYI